MSASSRGGRALQDAFTARFRSAAPKLCSWCAAAPSARPSGRFASTSAPAPASSSAAPAAEASPPDLTSARPPEPGPTATAAAAAAAAAAYDVRAGLILTRPPLLTRRLHPFENAFFFYQKRLEERLNTAFMTSIYFKPDTARQLDWDIKIKERGGTVAKELGVYHGKSARAWDDELRVGDALSSQEGLTACLLKDAEARISDDAEVLAPEDVVPVPPPQPRETDADRAGDVTRLDRKLDRTLYLVTEGSQGWGFPADVVTVDENLHEAARRVLDQAAGVNMNTWIVGRAPVAHIVSAPVVDADGAVLQRGCKTFFLKGRIMAGQANLKDNPFGYTAFRWLTREELADVLEPEYYLRVRNMMPDR